MPVPLTRRQFLTVMAAAAGTAATAGALEGLLNQLQEEPEAVLSSAAEEQLVPGVCLLCPSGCGVLSRVADGRVVKLEGNPMHPMNLGTLCPKGQAAPELLYNPDRLRGPQRRVGERGAGEWEPISWDEAVTLVADRLRNVRQAGNPEQVVLMHGEARGHLQPFFARFMEVYGSPNLISRESLNVAAAKLGVLLTQGVYRTPAYDLENSRYVITFGASLLEAGPVPQRMIAGYAFLRRGRAERGKVVVVDPRQGVTGAKADEWIPIQPGTDAALALGMCNVIIRSGLMDSSFVNNFSFGYEDFPDESGTRLVQGFKNFVLENYEPDQVAAITGVPATTISRLAGEFATNRPAVAILPGKGGLLNVSLGGVYAAMAVHCLNALVGSLDTRGGVMTQRFPEIMPWPRSAPDDVARRGCGAPRVDGAGGKAPLARTAYQAVADGIADGYPVEVLFLYDANPVFETPGGARLVEALAQVPLVVSFSSFEDETGRYADLLLPEPTFLERYGDHFFEGLGYAGVGLRQPAVPARGNTLSTGDFFLRLAAALGEPLASSLPWKTYQGLLRDRLRNVGTDWETFSGLGVWMTPGYPFARRGSQQWVEEVVGPERRYAPRDGHFDFFSRELKCIISALPEAELARLGLDPADETTFLPRYVPTSFVGDAETFPLLLNVITLMSLGPVSAAANMPTLQEISGMTVHETWDSWLEMNPETAHELGLHDYEEVWVESLFGRVKTRLRFVAALRPDVVNLPYNQGHTAVGRWARDRGVNGLALLSPATEPLSGLAAFTNTRVRVYRA